MKRSKGHKKIKDFLDRFLKPYNTTYEEEKKIKGSRQRFDFYLTAKVPIAIEYDGKQHKKFNSHFHKSSKDLFKAEYLDKEKKKYCIRNNIHLLRFEKQKELNYKDFFKKINEIFEDREDI